MTVGVLSRMTVPVDSGLKISGMTFTSLSFFTWYRNTFCHSRESGNPVLKESGSPIKLGMTSYLILDRRFQRWHNVVIIYILFVFYLYFICILFVFYLSFWKCSIKRGSISCKIQIRSFKKTDVAWNPSDILMPLLQEENV